MYTNCVAYNHIHRLLNIINYVCNHLHVPVSKAFSGMCHIRGLSRTCRIVTYIPVVTFAMKMCTNMLCRAR